MHCDSSRQQKHNNRHLFPMKHCLLTAIMALVIGMAAAGAFGQNPAVAPRVAIPELFVPRSPQTISLGYNPRSLFYAADGTLRDNFFLTFSDVEVKYNDQDQSISISQAGWVLFLDLYATNVPSGDRAYVLPAGEYEKGDGTADMTYGAEYSYAVQVDDEGNMLTFPVEGTVGVTCDEGGLYTLSCHCTGNDGTQHHFQTAPTTLIYHNTQGGQTGSILPQIGTDIITDFTGARASYRGNLFGANTGNMVISFYDCDFDHETGAHTGTGYCVQLCLFNRLFAESSAAQIVPGSYSRKTNFSKFSYYPGIEVTYSGITGIIGCLAQYHKAATDGSDDTYAYACITDGTVDIEDNPDGTFTVAIDMQTLDGHTVRGNYVGRIPVFDDSADEPTVHISNLEDNVVLDLAQIPTARLYRMDDIAGLGRWTLDIGSRGGLDQSIVDNGGDIIRMELLTDNALYADIPDGTYEVLPNRNENSLVEGALMPGYFYNGGELTGTCYQHFAEGRYLVMDLLAPAVEGNVSIRTETDGTKVFVMDLIDDAGYSISGSWRGPVKLMTEVPEGIATVETDLEADTQLYDLYGRRMGRHTLQRGIQLVQTKDGIRKVLR